MRVTFDTNVLVSATFWNGASSKLMEMAQICDINLVLSDDILNEYFRVLDYEEIKDKIKDKNLEIKESMMGILNLVEIVSPKNRIDIIKEDPSDNIILECALEGKVDYIISQDKHLLKLKEFKGIKIVKPEDFLLMFPDY
ncbi:putative toxin-antitoxin system toxin component, PIN family [Candidatus Pacearchaeota archaeon CG10_big_fil_rev_8_21_14_0_10_31_24]|nr:MAG: putative toxin-antitoxin system toxin component, PIN family [Candidatus Pacearchaeota archaeon CG10_big_fil_rev_8_21_14_0_10_31_24]